MDSQNIFKEMFDSIQYSKLHTKLEKYLKYDFVKKNMEIEAVFTKAELIYTTYMAHTHTHIYIYIYIYTYKSTDRYTSKYIYVYILPCKWKWTYTLYIYIYIYIYI